MADHNWTGLWNPQFSCNCNQTVKDWSQTGRKLVRTGCLRLVLTYLQASCLHYTHSHTTQHHPYYAAHMHSAKQVWQMLYYIFRKFCCVCFLPITDAAGFLPTCCTYIPTQHNKSHSMQQHSPTHAGNPIGSHYILCKFLFCVFYWLLTLQACCPHVTHTHTHQRSLITQNTGTLSLTPTPHLTTTMPSTLLCRATPNTNMNQHHHQLRHWPRHDHQCNNDNHDGHHHHQRHMSLTMAIAATTNDTTTTSRCHWPPTQWHQPPPPSAAASSTTQCP